MTARLRPCLEPGCSATTTGSRCAEHQRYVDRAFEARRAARRAREEPWREVYATAEWKQARVRALRRAGFRCEFIEGGERCLRMHGHGQALQVHHVIPLSEGGAPYDDANLRVLCPDHHAHVERRRDERAEMRSHAASTADIGRVIADAAEGIRRR